MRRRRRSRCALSRPRLPYSNGRVGVVGYCSRGRQAYLVAWSLDVDAAADCYGGRVVAADDEFTPQLHCPLVGLFGAEDENPSPTRCADRAGSRAHGKTFEFHIFENAGHAFFSSDRPNYARSRAAKEGWKRIWAFFGQNLANGVASKL